ncbi:MAG: hypothetical protein LBT50_10315 [Prevotellaceae bacterium]|jgi:hypothetical protein|nr:hypothetical protein [Prevotellaceae bacterium]
MQTYKFNTKISKEGIISLPFLPLLYDREVEIIIVPKEKEREKEKSSASAFLEKWAGAFSDLKDADFDEVKYEYLREKHK